MQLKSILIVVIIGAIYVHETEAVAKLALVKAKVALVKAPHVIAKVSVAKEVLAKKKIAAAKTLAAVKASKVAALSALTAPFRAAKRTLALKVAGVKALKAIKVAKIANTALILKNLKKSPIILPVPVAVPLKALPVPVPFPKPALPSLPNFFNIPSPSLGDSLGPIQGIISGAQKAIKTAGAGIPLLSSFTQGFGNSESKAPKDVPAITPPPVYRFVPEVGFTNYNKVSYQPPVEVEVPSVVYSAPTPIYAPSVVPVAPIHTPASTYGVPN
ncbi:uncharacterized protein LOC129575929 [Sitodiplosis mosellana]|uniref:uncharacterized protein LOC129575929 n=1 Tax=Sitodiplosis mosellana TaxID=263140 RepID=UPI00244380D1|nr:uncharacterized protein LOC129575929 [Sitodiplosis mosellana]